MENGTFLWLTVYYITLWLHVY